MTSMNLSRHLLDGIAFCKTLSMSAEPQASLYPTDNRQLEEHYQDGVCKAIGVANFCTRQLRPLVNECRCIRLSVPSPPRSPV